MAKFFAFAVLFAVVIAMTAAQQGPRPGQPGLHGQGPVRAANAPAGPAPGGKAGDLQTANSFYGGYGFGYPFYGGYYGYGGYPYYGGYYGGYGYGYPFYG